MEYKPDYREIYNRVDACSHHYKCPCGTDGCNDYQYLQQFKNKKKEVERNG